MQDKGRKPKINMVRNILEIIFILVALTGCVSSVVTSSAQVAYNHHTLQNTLHDTYLEVKIDRAVHWSTDHFQSSHINIDVFNNVVILTGQTSSSQLHDELGRIAKEVSGADEVYNLTTIRNALSRLIRIQDAWITTKIKSRLLAEIEIDPSQIKVVTENGTVYLIGIIFPDQAAIATEIARTTSGVQNVVRVFSYLQITKTSPKY
jgi:osmotically-inducible protein OsmY